MHWTHFLASFILMWTCSSRGLSLTSDRRERSLDDDEDDFMRGQQEAANLSATINGILKGYDLKLRPNAGGEPVKVNVQIKVVSFGKLNEASMDYSMDIFFRQWWHDPRFRHNSSTPFNMAADPTELLWTPDTYFFNVKRIKYHYVTRENMRVMIHSNGYIYFSARITLTAQCDMDFRLYPMDTQHCSLIIESYAHTTDDVDYKWRKVKGKPKGIEIASKEMAQFELAGIETKSKDTKNSKGSFARLRVVFSFKRRLEYFVSSVFSPAVTLVVLSWCCFWISRDAVPARVSLGITIILTAIVLCGSVNEAMPPVSYTKAQDYFILVSFGFIFFSFLEFVIVLNTDPEPKWLRMMRRCCGKKAEEEEKRPLNREEVLQPEDDEEKFGAEPEIDILPDHAPEAEHQTDVEAPVTNHVTSRNHSQPRRVVVSNGQQGATVMLFDEFGEIRHGKFKMKPTNAETPKKRRLSKAHWADLISRVIFPTSYITFLVLFWRTFVQQLPITGAASS